MSKPRISFVRPVFFGLVCAGVFKCDSPEATAFGSTPKEAYEKWKADMPKTAAGRACRRMLNRVADIFV